MKLSKVLMRAIEMRQTYPKSRWGQCLFSALHEVDPDLAFEITGTSCDPFYVEDGAKEGTRGFETIEDFIQKVLDSD